MSEKTGSTALAILLTIVALFIGLIGIGVLIGVGEAANNGIVAFAAVSFPFALIAGLFSWAAPKARWAIGVAISAPVAIICLLSGWAGVMYLLGAIWTVGLSCAGAYLGGRLRASRPGPRQEPPPEIH